MENADFDVVSERINDIFGNKKSKYNISEKEKQHIILSNCMLIQLAAFVKQRGLNSMGDDVVEDIDKWLDTLK